ncbi:hypothetical protein NIE88_16050 [Sporolactobacillus shoreicorticis]|uniref:Acetolactate synthase small subunit C-terminal domain-containing protein n=1 Tax=Sporolactobacillus shoreicorticis TaxID=1923877 RepID=A0ABW5S964_9BACL|nr:hypothetical protein [Sporolactobacillus shoreicorticis]MCO7127282.1 hypothetical protein [Sporolactobacillus shoreicorticis]
MEQNMNVELTNQDELYDYLSNALGGRDRYTKKVCVTRHADTTAVTYELAKTKAASSAHELKQTDPQSDCELVTICLLLSSEADACHVSHLISKYQATFTDIRDSTYIVTAVASARQIDALISALLPHGVTAMSRTGIGQDNADPYLVKNKRLEKNKARSVPAADHLFILSF